MTNHTKKSRKWLSSLPIVLALVVSIMFGYAEAYQAMNNSQYFSSDSLQAFRSLNFQYEIMVDDLSRPEDSDLIVDLFKANVLIDDKVTNENRGLVATLDNRVGNGFLLLEPTTEMSEVELNSIAEIYEEAIPEFENVEVDQDVELFGDPIFWQNWGPAEVQLSSDELEPDEETGSFVVAVVDSGIDPNHEIFEAHKMLTGWNTIDGNTEMYDDVGHGTHIAGIIASEMAGVAIEPYKIVGANGGKLSNVIEALERAIEDDVDVINTSFGLFSPSYSLNRVIEEAYQQGIIVVSAAGNSDSSAGFYPATYDNTISVASLYPNGTKMEKSNYGDWVDVATLGYRVHSSLPDNSYGYKSGTSQATAFISAEVAKILAANGLDNDISFEEVLEQLLEDRELIEEGELEGVAIIE